MPFAADKPAVPAPYHAIRRLYVCCPGALLQGGMPRPKPLHAALLFPVVYIFARSASVVSSPIVTSSVPVSFANSAMSSRFSAVETTEWCAPPA